MGQVFELSPINKRAKDELFRRNSYFSTSLSTQSIDRVILRILEHQEIHDGVRAARIGAAILESSGPRQAGSNRRERVFLELKQGAKEKRAHLAPPHALNLDEFCPLCQLELRTLLRSYSLEEG